MADRASLGSRRTLVQVQAATTTTDALGQDVERWATVATLWGRVRAPYAREVAVAGQVEAVLTDVVEAGWPGDGVVTPLRRLLIGARTLNVVGAVDVDGLNRDLLIFALERVEPDPNADG